LAASSITAAVGTQSAPPLSSATLPIGSGTTTFRRTVLNTTAIRLAGRPADAATLYIDGVVLGAGTTVTTTNLAGDLGQYAFAGTLRAGGWNINRGTITATSSDFQRTATLDIDIVNSARPNAASPIFVNAGTVACNPMGIVDVHADAPGSTLRNLGLISVAGHATLGTKVDGTGTIRLETAIPLHGFTATPELTTTAGIGAGQTIAFLGGDVLRVGDLANFHALITGFSGALTAGALDRIELTGHDITSSVWKSNGGQGTLTLLEGTSVAGELRFAGSFAAAPFTLQHLNLVTAAGLTHTTYVTANQA
jgi:hypothetical protein